MISRRTAYALSALGIVALLVVLVVSTAGAKPGNVDQTFGKKGVVTLADNTELVGAATQRDGKLVAVGVKAQGTTTKLIVERFTAAGKPDRTFSGNGVFEGPAKTVGRDVAIQRDGKIVVAGALGSGSLTEGMLLMRLKPG